MNISEFIETLYLGDRACKAIIIDGWDSLLKVQVDRISRCENGVWNYSEKGDIVDGYIVFCGVTSMTFDPPGYIPNDYISKIETALSIKGGHRVSIYIDSVDDEAKHTNVKLTLTATEAYLEDPSRPNEKIF